LSQNIMYPVETDANWGAKESEYQSNSQRYN